MFVFFWGGGGGVPFQNLQLDGFVLRPGNEPPEILSPHFPVGENGCMYRFRIVLFMFSFHIPIGSEYGIFTYINHIHISQMWVNISYMDPMGIDEYLCDQHDSVKEYFCSLVPSIVKIKSSGPFASFTGFLYAYQKTAQLLVVVLISISGISKE